MKALRDLEAQGLPKFKAKERKIIEQWRTLRLPQLRTVVHQRENEVLNQALEEAMSFTEAEAEALLDESNPLTDQDSSVIITEAGGELMNDSLKHEQGSN